VKQLTKEQAIAMAESGAWKDMNSHERCEFQLFQQRLCMPFHEFHKAVEATLGRPVYTHEFGSGGRLAEEFLGEKDAPTWEEIVALIPKDKLMVIKVD